MLIIYIYLLVSTMPQKTRTKQRINGSQSPQIIEKHSSYASNTTFDGENLIIDTKINDQPVDHRVYSIHELRKTNPLGASLVKDYLKGRIPKTLKRPAPDMLLPHIRINPVLPNLGLNGRRDQDRESDGIRLYIRDNNGELAPMNELPLSSSNKNKFRRRKTRKMK